MASQSIQTSVRSIVINDTATEQTAIEIGSPLTAVTDILFFDEDEDGFVSKCTGSLIAENYILTAQHCFDPLSGEVSPEDLTVRFRDENNAFLEDIAVSEISFLDETFNLYDGTDIAFLKLAEDAPESIDPLKLFGGDPDELIGSNATLVGFGLRGLGSEGVDEELIESEFDQNGLRWGAENTIDVVDGVFDPDLSVLFDSNIIELDFDDDNSSTNTLVSLGSSPVPLENEGSGAVGDSGGPLLVEKNDELLIVGVLTGGLFPTSEFGNIFDYTGVSKYRDAIEKLGGQFVGDFVMEEPEATDDIQNGSFEEGLSGWSIIGAAGSPTDLGTPTSDGESDALIYNDLIAVSDYEIEEFLGLTAGSLENLSGRFPFEGSAIKQTFTANAGDMVSFDFNFLTDELAAEDFGEEMFNDFSFVSLSGADTYLDLLADTSSDFVPSDTYFFNETGYQSFYYEIRETGTYTLGFGVADAEEFTGFSGLLVDNVALVSTPEPTTTIGLFATVFGAFSLLKRKRKQFQ
ncbi:trypsin-like serine protease [Okeania sp. KiyG1]|uniref:trypsin-like serine protease n=1 Tax=Okeania sp. KiyG1 TaxID=2720165 RepID=UPI00192218E4|nr:trypsin-like serine protease [Okeania sp. KiyG1]